MILLSFAHAAAPLTYDPLAADVPSPLEISYDGDVLLEDRPGQALIDLANKGTADVHISETLLVAAPSGFTLAAPVTGTVAPGKSVVLVVPWDPSKGGGTVGTVIVRTREGVSLATLTARDTPPPDNTLPAGAPVSPTDVRGLVGTRGTQLGGGTPAATAPPPKGITIGAPIILGALDKSLMDAVITAKLPEITGCCDTKATPASPAGSS